MTTDMKPLTPITQEDLEWATQYIEAAQRSPSFNAVEFIESEGERLKFDWRALHEHVEGNGALAGAVHFGLLLAEAQRHRFVLDNYQADVNDLKEAC